MPLPYSSNIQNTIRDREYGLSSLMPDTGDYDFGSAASSLSYFQDLMNQTSRADLGMRATGSLYDAIGGAAWGFTDMATAHLLRGSWAFDTKGRSLAEAVGGVDMATKAGQYAEQTGQALGFLPPMGKVAKAIRWGVQGTKYGARTVAKSLASDTAQKLSAKGAVTFQSKQAAANAGGRSAPKHFFEAVDDAFIKRWYNKSGPAKVDGFNTAFQKVADKNKFVTNVRENMGTSLAKMAEERGVILNPKVADDITEIFSTYFTNPKKFPVSSIGEMVARKFGVESKLATAYTHMFEEAVTFAAFEGLLEAVDSTQQERDYDIGVLGHAAAMGHVLGAIRFVPGGKKAGGTIFGHGGGITQYRAILRGLKPFKNRIDPKNDAHRAGAFKLWEYLVDGNPFRHKNTTGSVLKDYAERHPIWKAGTFSGKKAESIFTASPTNISTILKDGTAKQKEAMGNVLRDSLDKIRVDMKRDWFPQFMQEYKSDLIGSLPRMFIGGIAMSGGPGIFFDENISTEDKIFSIMLGGFMMRRGHELSTRKVVDKIGKDGKATSVISFTEPTGYLGGKKETAYGEHFERLTQDIRSLGGNPFSWGGYSDLLAGRGSPALETIHNIPISESSFGKRLKGVLEKSVTKAGNPIITTEKELKVFKRNPKTDPSEAVEATYELYLQAVSNEVPVETNMKGWDNLSSAGKKEVAKQLAKHNFRTPEDVYEARVADSVDILSTLDQLIIRSEVDAISNIEINGRKIERTPDSNGIYRLPKLRADEVSPREREAVTLYNEYLNLLESSGKIKVDVSEELGSPFYRVNSDTPGIERFVSQVEKGHQNYSDAFGYTKESNYEIFPGSRTFVDLMRVKTFFENKSKFQEIYNYFNTPGDIKTGNEVRDAKLELAKRLYSDIFTNKTDGMYRGYIKLKTGDWRNKNFVKNLGRLAEVQWATQHGVKGMKDKVDDTVSNEKVKQLREIFRSEGINLFEKRGHLSNVFVEQAVADRWKKEFISSGKWGSNNKKQPLDSSDEATILSLVETGFLDKTLTMGTWGNFENTFSQLANKSKKNWYNMFISGKASDVQALVSEMKAIGKSQDIDTSSITNENMQRVAGEFRKMVKQMVDSPSHPEIKNEKDAMSQLSGDIAFIYKTIEKRVKPLIQDVRNGERAGIIKINRNDKIHFTPDGVVYLKNHMLGLEKARQSSDVDAFITELSNATIDPSKRMKGFSNYLLRQMTSQNWKFGDSVKIMELASAHRMWNPIERKFETDNMDATTLDNAVRKVFKGMIRGDVDSAATVESHMKRLERDYLEDGIMENTYSSVTFGDLVKKYDFTEYDFAIGRTGATVERQIHPNGGIETPEVQLQNIYDRHYTADRRGQFMEGLYESATMKKKDGTRFKGDTDTLVREVGKVMLDLSNSVNAPILMMNLHTDAPQMTMIANNKMRRSPVYDSIERAMGGIPGVTNHLQIIPEKFTGIGKINVLNKETGKWEKKIRPEVKSLSHMKMEGNVATYPNEVEMNRMLFQSEKLTFDESFKRSEGGEPEHIKVPRGVLYMPFAQKWGYNVAATPEMLQIQAKTFSDKLNAQKVPKELKEEWLEDLDISFNKKGELVIDASTIDNPVGAQQWVKKIMDKSIGMDLFKDNYIKEKLYEMDGELLGDYMKRGSLFYNTNSNTLQPDVLSDIANFYGKYGKTSSLQASSKFFKNLIAGNEKQVFVSDEGKRDMYDLFSNHTKEIEQRLTEYDNIKPTDKKHEGEIKNTVEGIEKYLQIVREAKRFASEDSSPSGQDSGSVMESGRFDAVASLYGAVPEHNIGGIKVIVQRSGNDFYVDKTALTKNTYYDEFFKNNSDVARISFTSGSKKIGGKYFGEMAESINPGVEGWESSTDLKKMSLKPEDIKISFIKNNKLKATISPNTSVFLKDSPTDKAVDAYYDYYHKNKIEEGVSQLSQLYKIDNYAEAIAQNKLWNKELVTSSTAEWAMDSPLATEQHWANANMIPYIKGHDRGWNNNVKTQILDKMIRVKEDGGQFVSQGIHPLDRVENSVHYHDGTRGRLHRMGEYNAPYSMRASRFDKNNIFFYKTKEAKDVSHDTGKDLVTWNELKATAGLKTYEMQTIMTENGVFPVHTRYKTGDKTRHGTVKSVQNIEKQQGGEWWQSKDIGELNDRIPEGYRIFNYAKRDPVVGGDSVIPILLKREWKAEKDGNAGSLNEMDGHLSAELDHDIDIVNVWWNGPRPFAEKIMSRKGEVPFAQAPTADVKSSMNELKPFDLDSHRIYRGRLKDAEILKGKLMNYSGILDWLWNSNSGQMLAGKKGEGSSTGFHVGKNIFAAVAFSPQQKQKIKQRLRNDIQGIVDGTGGYDLNYYKKWEKDFLFKGDGVSPPVFSAYRNIEGEQMKRISGQDKFNVEVPDAGQQLIINNLISPYRHLKSLTNSKWEGTRKQKIELDELIAGVRAYDSELQWANVRAQKEAGEQNYGVDYNNKDIFNGWNYEARIFGKNKDFSGTLPFDRVLHSVVSMDYRNLIDVPAHGTRNPYEYSDIAETLIHNKNASDFARQWGNEFRNLVDAQFFIKNMKSKVNNLRKLASKVWESDPKLQRSLNRKANEIQQIINKKWKSETFRYREDKRGNLKEQQRIFADGKVKWIDKKSGNREFPKLWKEVKNHWRQQLLKAELHGKIGEKRKEAEENWHNRNNTYGDKKKGTKDKLVLNKIQKKGLVVEAHPDHEMISAMAAHDAFGLLAHQKPYEYTRNPSQTKAMHQEILTEANRIGQSYSRTYKGVMDGTIPAHSKKQIEENFHSRLNEAYRKYHDIGGENLANTFLWQLMSPKFDLSKLVITGNKMYFAPSEGNWDARIRLGFRFITQTPLMTPEAKTTIFNEYVGHLNRSFLAFHHHKGQNDLFMSSSDIMKRNEETGALERRTEGGLLDIRNQFKINPLSYSKNGTMEDVLHEVHPGFEGMSATMSYKQMLEMFGSGGIPQVLEMHRAFYMPAAAVTDASAFGPHMSINGYHSFKQAKKKGIHAFVENQQSRSTLDPEGTFEKVNSMEYSKREKKLEEDMYEVYSQISCNQGNGGI